MRNYNMQPTTKQGYQLLHDGVRALAEVEGNGIRIDLEYLEKTIRQLERKIKLYHTKLRESKVWKTWRHRFGPGAQMGSREQLGEVLFTVMGYPCHEKTKTGKPKVDESALERVDLPFVRKYLELAKMEKALGTYLKGIQYETMPDGYMHPSFNLHTVQTYRSSSDSPNFQNMPIRHPVMGKLIRRCFIARPGHVFGEIDFGSIEVRVSACYNKDPKLIEYVKDPTTDMHRDMAMQIFDLKQNEVDKKTHRQIAKNMFVFPQFYGDYYIHNAKDIWEAMTRENVKGPAGDPIKEFFIDAHGITELGPLNPKEEPGPHTFEKWMKDIEYDFWNNRFAVYNQWKKDWWQQYKETNTLEMYTGFVIRGILNRKECSNYPVQGSAFHCLLWSLIQLNKWLKKHRFESKIVGQIHDSIVLDIKIQELEDVLGAAKYIMTKLIRKHYPWIIVPFEVEADIAPEGGSWYDKKAYDLTAV